MSGGGIGQICNLIPYDRHYEAVIVNAGSNEIKEESLQEFVYTMNKSEDKLRKLATSTQVTVVLPPVCTTTPEMIAKSHYVHDVVKKIETVSTITLEDIETVDNDFHRHPTVEGTKSIIKQINVAMNEQIVLKDCIDDAVFALKYRQVQTVFKVGCRGCDSHEYTPALCANCKEMAKDVDVTLLEAKIKKLKDNMFPQIEEVEMRDPNSKRAHSSDDDDAKLPPKAVKPCP